jgi:hypothetical protein
MGWRTDLERATITDRYGLRRMAPPSDARELRRSRAVYTFNYTFPHSKDRAWTPSLRSSSGSVI